MNKIVDKLKKKVSLYQMSIDERKKQFDESLKKLDIPNAQFQYMKEELDKLRGKTL